MYKKLLIVSSVFIVAIFSFSVCFANDGLQNVANDVRNAVGNAENTVEDAAKNISNASKNVTGQIEEDTNKTGNAIMNNVDNSTTNNYTATKTSTTDNTFMGMNATAWTWLIIGIVAIAIVALVWYYSMQVRSSNYDGKD